MLFFKRISDVYDEEYAQALEDSDGDLEYASFAENHRFQIPEGCRWRDVREQTANVGMSIQQALRGIEQANPHTLYGIFGDAQWSNKDRLSDELLRDLIEHFSRHTLTNKAAEADLMGQAYEYLIKKFADLTNKKAGEFYTPRSVVRLLVNILDPQPGETIYDPACGTGGMLLESVHHVAATGGNIKLLWGKLFGQEKNLTTSGIARMNLFLHGVEDFNILRGDTLREPAFFEGDRLSTFDCVIANPPFSLENWGDTQWISDRFGRNIAGLPPRKYGDYAWVQHMIRSMAPVKGRLAVVLPHGALFRMGAEGEIRRRLIERDLIEAVIGLGPNLFYGTGLAACVLILRDRKPADRANRILLVDGSRLFRAGRNQNTLEPEHAQQLFSLYHEFHEAPGLSFVASNEAVLGNDGNLNISLYVQEPHEDEGPSLAEALANLRHSLDEAYAAEDRLKDLLRQEGLLK